MAGKRGISVNDLFGGRFISPEAARRSMAALEKQLDADFAARTRLRKQLTASPEKISAPFLDASEKGAAASAARELRRLHHVARGLKVQRPRIVKVNGGIFTGLSGATVAPPFDYQWSWSAVSGDDPGDNSVSADRASGDLSLILDTGIDDSSSSAARAAVGIYFYPPLSNGTLQVWSAPWFSYLWGTFCSFASAHADGWIGMYVGSYDLSGKFTGAVIDSRVSLWSHDQWFGSTTNSDFSSGYGLYPPPVHVDRQHQYIIWAWCGGEISADGWHALWGSGATDQFYVAVPSITWEFQPVWVVEAAP
jgi:hypothetical protein